ncbi:polysaccharide biosynthesis/export family protein [Pleomorphovibrio marinus]|uniref:polysaccharide biosynthesis/export family protein n=1 Tax=Pleomorphovibrio marinus TaxID=2164132 RepID=UPI000E0A78A1|nr:polysaccharide biosynthesis/export family protein [Pleomorphovibrio marinus]
MRRFFNILLILTAIVGCSKRNLVYFSDIDVDSQYSVEIPDISKPKIQKNDILRITVSSLSPESNLLFNLGVVNPRENNNPPQLANTNPQAQVPMDGYLVDGNGEINFPVLGKIKLEGLTKEEAIEELTFLLREHVKDPIVNMRFMNFRVTVIGEVNSPSSFIVNSDQVSVLEALGLAGDMTEFGKRENVLIIRENNGVRQATRLDLNKKDFLNSEYYYLRQNDVVYVEPDKMKAIRAGTNQRNLTILSVVASLTTALLFNIRFILTGG